MVKRLLSQLVILLSIASLIGITFTAYKLNFIVGFFLGIFIQFGAYYAYVTTLNAYVALTDKKLENERIKDLSFQSIEVVCPCYKKVKDVVPVRLNTDNKYKCAECNKTVSVYISTETAIVTEPILNTDADTLNKAITESIKNANT